MCDFNYPVLIGKIIIIVEYARMVGREMCETRGLLLEPKQKRRAWLTDGFVVRLRTYGVRVHQNCPQAWALLDNTPPYGNNDS
jgi:hypothetical protein